MTTQDAKTIVKLTLQQALEHLLQDLDGRFTEWMRIGWNQVIWGNADRYVEAQLVEQGNAEQYEILRLTLYHNSMRSNAFDLQLNHPDYGCASTTMTEVDKNYWGKRAGQYSSSRQTFNGYTPNTSDLAVDIERVLRFLNVSIQED